MKPLIKWPGGKSGEIQQFIHMIPEFDRYIEPFVGGGALFFYLNPARAVINDTSAYLMQFYRLIRENDPELKRILNLYDRSFSALKERCERQYPRIRSLYRLYEAAAEKEIDTAGLGIHKALVSRIADDIEISGDLIPDRDDYLRKMEASVEDKCLRTVKNTARKAFSEKDLKKNLITGFTSGFYLYFRDIFNDIAAGRLVCSEAYRIANFYFVREYCYGSMFRYNADGEFNIPYGGASYNRKDLSEKIRQMFDADAVALLGRTEICCMDFEELMDGLDVTDRDFMFLDPPYDTEFSDYEGRCFGAEDHRRLAGLLGKIPAQFILVIKDTPLIRTLYEGRFRILTFENHYTYNVRSRNERQSRHLIVTNIPEDTVPWIRENVT